MVFICSLFFHTCSHYFRIPKGYQIPTWYESMVCETKVCGVANWTSHKLGCTSRTSFQESAKVEGLGFIRGSSGFIVSSPTRFIEEYWGYSHCSGGYIPIVDGWIPNFWFVESWCWLIKTLMLSSRNVELQLNRPIGFLFLSVYELQTNQYVSSHLPINRGC